MASSMNKAMLLGMGNEFGGKPDIFLQEMEIYKKLTKADIMRVYEQYFKGKPSLILSVVPKGKQNLAVANSTATYAVMENVADQKMKAQDGKIVDDAYPFTPSKIDRTKEPDFLANTPSFNVPKIWTKELTNGIKVQGIANAEIPMITFSMTMGGGRLFDAKGKNGTAYLTAALMSEGTEFRTPAQLAKDIAMLGANVSVSAGLEDITIRGNCLARNFPKVMSIIEEMILHPRYDATELENIKARVSVMIKQNSVNPQSIAGGAATKLLFGKESPLAIPAYGTAETLAAITMDDIKAHYAAYTTSKLCKFNIVGSATAPEVEKATASLVKKWNGKDVTIPAPYIGETAQTNKIYFIDQPGAQQSVIMLIKKGPLYTNNDFYPCVILNRALGSGSNGVLFEVLRLQKGYTYGAYSNFSGNKYYGLFNASSSVQGSVTREAVDLFNDIIRNYGSEYTQKKLDETKEAMLKENCGSMETQDAMLGMLSTISDYGKPQNYMLEQEQIIKNMTLEQIKDIATKYLKSDEFIYVVVGDAKTQFPRFIGAELIEK
jgi:zinc protease